MITTSKKNVEDGETTSDERFDLLNSKDAEHDTGLEEGLQGGLDDDDSIAVPEFCLDGELSKFNEIISECSTPDQNF